MVMREGGPDAPGKWLGLIVFVLGIGLLLFVFVRGFDAFTRVDDLVRPQGQGGGLNLESAFLLALGRWLLLFLLAYIASAMAGRGIALYQAARALPGDEG